MEQRARRWIAWSCVIAALVVSLLAAAFVAFWYVSWPFSPRFVIEKSPWFEPQLRALMKHDAAQTLVLHDERPWLQSTIVEKMYEPGRGDEARLAILTCLQSDDARLRESTLQVIGDYDLPEAFTTEPTVQRLVLEMTDDQDRSVRYWALMAACDRFEHDTVVPLLKKHLNEVLGPESVYELRLKALRNLSIPGDQTLVPWVTALLDDESVRVEAIETLAKIGDPSSVPSVRRYAADPDVRVRQAVEDFMKGMSPSANAPQQ